MRNNHHDAAVASPSSQNRVKLISDESGSAYTHLFMRLGVCTWSAKPFTFSRSKVSLSEVGDLDKTHLRPIRDGEGRRPLPRRTLGIDDSLGCVGSALQVR